MSFFIRSNGYPGDSIPVVAVETQQQRMPKLVVKLNEAVDLLLPQIGLGSCFASFHLTTDFGITLLRCFEVQG